MSLTGPLRAARETLGVAPGADARAIKRAYREQLAAHPPDRDEAGFRAIRGAYELLRDPSVLVRERFGSQTALVEPPAAPPAPAPPKPGEAARRVLRALMSDLDVTSLFTDDAVIHEASGDGDGSHRA